MATEEEEKAPKAPPAAKRMKGVVIDVPIVYGSMAWPLSKRADDTSQHTHRWTIYLRSPSNDDMSYFIKKVVFNLHASFGDRAKRTVDTPPYEIEDTGWGEFEAHIRIHFHDSAERPIDLYHGLRLHPAEGQVVSPKKPVVAETYEELVFNEPTEQMYKRLKAGGEKMTKSIYAEFFVEFNEESELKKIKHAHKKVKAEIARIREQQEKAEAESKELQSDINAAGGADI